MSDAMCAKFPLHHPTIECNRKLTIILQDLFHHSDHLKAAGGKKISDYLFSVSELRGCALIYSVCVVLLNVWG